MNELQHPAILLNKIIKASWLTVDEFGKEVNITTQMLEYILGKRNSCWPISAMKLERYTGVDASIWTEYYYRIKSKREYKTKVRKVVIAKTYEDYLIKSSEIAKKKWEKWDSKEEIKKNVRLSKGQTYLL